MFDMGFFELALIGVVALLVVGPERLPGLARTAGAWIRRMRQFVGSVQRDIEQEIQAEEIKKTLEAAKSMPSNPLQASLEYARQEGEALNAALQDTGKVVAEELQQQTAASPKTTPQTASHAGDMKQAESG
jgi:sec-independent protein translocase protein TatB